ncbi:MAG: carboxypeptidase-like regulatory domain-containing protein [Candidatus Aminicenantes bacterium]|nr:carboxypeptidase-like regulatory domain-containing protein [Candidatus Aminicenantes bacterium]
MRHGAKGVVSWGLAVALVLVFSSPGSFAQTPNKGNLVGFVFGRDGSTPVAGAVVVVKNVSTGAVTESDGSDDLGVFRLAGLDVGIYAIGVKSTAGNYNSQDFFGVAAQQTSKLTIALNPYDAISASAAEAVIKEQRYKGEAYIGKVVKYDPDAQEAEVFVEIGLVQKEDRIHVKGQVTDFYQDLNKLSAYGAKADRVTSGYTAVVKASKACVEGDFVYIVCKRGIPPFFLAPLGIAAIVAGAVPLSAHFEEVVSPYKIK